MHTRFYLPSLLIVFLLIQLVLPVDLKASTADDLKSSLDTLSAQINQLDQEIKEYNNKINQTQGEAKTLKAALASLELRRTALAKQINLTKLRITQTQSNIVSTQGKIAITESTLAKNKRALAEAVRSLVYQDSKIPSFITVLRPGGHLSDTLDALKRGTDASRAIDSKVQTLAQTKEELHSQKTIYESNKKKLEELNSSLTDQKQLVEQTTKDKNTLLIETKNKESQYQQMLADRQRKKGELEAEMLDVESRLKVYVDTSKLPKYGKGVLQYPLSNVVITQYFGNTPFASRNPQVYNGSGHNGVDFSARIGTPILAAESGEVVGTGNTDAACAGVSYGKWILIRHTNGLSTLYAHLSVIQVVAGQKVMAGQKIGLSGNTGYSTGPHLHFTVYAADSVHISKPTEYKSKVCGTYMIMPLAPPQGYLNPLSYL